MIVVAELKATGGPPMAGSAAVASARGPDEARFDDAFAELAIPQTHGGTSALIPADTGLAASATARGEIAQVALVPDGIPGQKYSMTGDGAKGASMGEGRTAAPAPTQEGPAAAAMPVRAGAVLAQRDPAGPQPAVADEAPGPAAGDRALAGDALGARGGGTIAGDATGPGPGDGGARASESSTGPHPPHRVQTAEHPPAGQLRPPSNVRDAAKGAALSAPRGDAPTARAPAPLPQAAHDTVQGTGTKRPAGPAPAPHLSGSVGPEGALPHSTGESAAPAGPAARDAALAPPAQAIAATAASAAAEPVLRQVVGALPPRPGAAAQGMAELALSPPELGSVRMVFATTEAGLSVLVTADRPETQDLLRRNADLLLRDLRDAGHAAVTLDFTGGSDGRRTPPDAPGTSHAGLDAAPAAPPPLSYPPAPTLRNGRLDLRM